MLLRWSRLPVVALSLCVTCVGHADVPAPAPAPAATTRPATAPAEPSAFDPARHMHTSEVRPGMTGYGLSVFRGTKIERFDVEVISVMRNQVGPGHDIVLIRCRGQGLEHSGAVEGMSGSPIYLRDDAGRERLIGAFALGWEHSKDPIAGVRPIEEMLRVPTALAIPSTRPTVVAAGRTWDAVPLVTTAAVPQTIQAANPRTSRLKRLSLPLTVAGLNDSAFARVAPWLRRDGLVPLQGGATAGADADPAAKLEPGAAIGIPIVTGDLDVSALGTVTEVLGDRIYAFGHEFNAEGAVDLPMGVGYVHTVIPTNTISFKMGSLLRLDGAIHSDESTAIAGRVGAVPAMIPVTITVRSPQRPAEQTFRFRITRHPKFTPMGAITGVLAALMSDSAPPVDFTVRYAMKLSFDNGQTVDLSDVATSATGAKQLARDMNVPLMLALGSPFGRAYPTAITATFDVQAGVRLDELRSAVTDQRVYKPGDSVGVFVTTRAYEGADSTRRVAIDLPNDLPDGDYTLTVGDAERMLADETRVAPYRYQVRDLKEVFDLIREVTHRPSTRLYLRLAAHEQGVSVGRTALRGLPPSRVRVLTRPGSADVMAYVPSISKDVPWPSPLSGSTDIEIKVSRTPDKVPRSDGTPNSPPRPPMPGVPVER
ncbi:MAG TPA: hypothetical protein VF595_06805 [Tepidisphaeraceae bacterium]